MTKENIKILGLKYPNIPHYEWQAKILEKTKDSVIVLSTPGNYIHHTKGQTLKYPAHSIEYYSYVNWNTVTLNVINGEIIDYYCNIALPSKLNENLLTFVDLDIDIIYKKETGWKVIDVDEFLINSRKYQYPKAIKERTIKETRKLLDKAINGKAPFDRTLKKYINKCK